ncbi:NADH dehydrogenase [ubiquinone] iron-sulfur protein 1, mitochondrial [Tanacetum coccineum]
MKKQVPVASSSPKTKIYDRKFVVAKKSKNSKAEPLEDDKASQDEFTKIKNVTEKDNVVAEIGDEIFREREKVSERVKRGGEKLLERLNDPMIRGADGRFQPVSWRDALAVVAEVIHQVKPEEIVGVASKLSDAESMILLKDFLNKLVEAAMVNARIHKTVRASQAKVGYIGAPADFNYNHEHLGTRPMKSC